MGFKLAKKMGYASPFVRDEGEKGFYDGGVDFKSILYPFGAAVYNDVEIPEETSFNPVVIFGKRRVFDYKNFIKEKGFSQLTTWKHDGQTYGGKVYLNKRIGALDGKKIFIKYEGSYEIARRTIYYSGHEVPHFSLYKSYEDDFDAGGLYMPNIDYLETNAAIKIKQLDLESILLIFNFFEDGSTNKTTLLVLKKLLMKSVKHFIFNASSVNRNYVLTILPEEYYTFFSKEELKKVFNGLLSQSTIIGYTEEAVLNVLAAFSAREDFNPTLFLDQLLSKIPNENTTYFRKLFDRMNLGNFDRFIYQIWGIWKKTLYSSFSEKNPKVTKTGEHLLNYKSNKTIGFHHDNAKIKLLNNSYIVQVDIEYKVGEPSSEYIMSSGYPAYGYMKTTQPTKKEKLFYHLYAPVAILKEDNPYFFFKDKDADENAKFAILPAFVILAREEKAFWANVITGAEYTLDVVTTFSGVANLLKAGRLFKILKAGHKLIGRTKVVANTITGIKTFAGVVEVTAGIGNGLVKLLGFKGTPLGDSIAEYLFYLEMLSLSGELSGALHLSLSKAAKKAVENPQLLKIKKQAEKIVDNANSTSTGKKSSKVVEAENVLEAIRHLEDIEGLDYSARLAIKVSKSLDNTFKEILEFESKFKNHEHEWGLVLNRRTKFKMHHTSNLVDEIKWPDNILKRIENCVVTHNHPSGSGLSIADLKFFISNKLTELRAVGPNGSVFSLRNGNILDHNTIKALDYNKDLVKLDKNIKAIEKKYVLNYKFAVGNTYRIDAKVFNEIFDLIKDKVTYTHYIN